MLSLRFPVPLPPKNTTLSHSQNKPFSSFTSDSALSKETKKSIPKFHMLLVNLSQQVELPAGLRRELMPKHVGNIPDGHSRWARQRGLSVQHGHSTIGRRLTELTRLCDKWGVQVFTVYGVSTETLIRPKEELDFLVSMFEEWVKSNMEEWARQNIRFSVIGNKSPLPRSIEQVLSEAEVALKANSGLHLMVALGYDGRYEIMQASKACLAK
ncbi:unnamed protein product [Ilex paraguariensis]|uniref:Alkyl transferase n=1 Tax=Ilex paraguariensis TaxID=185542 RepID=A0ABC8UP23_9AQUA